MRGEIISHPAAHPITQSLIGSENKKLVFDRRSLIQMGFFFGWGKIFFILFEGIVDLQ